MVNVRLSGKETCKLVELYRSYECLWNPDNDYYRCKRMHHAACEAIAREMNIEDFTAADVKTKIKTLRGTYNIERQKEKRSAQSGDIYVSKIKWLSIMDTFIPQLKDKHPPGKNSSSENADHRSESIFPENSQSEQSRSNSENVCMPNESDIEQSIRSITDTEVITVTPEMQAIQAEVFGVRPGIQSGQPVSNSPLVTVTPDILTLKAVSKSESTPVISEIKSIQSVSNSTVATAPLGIQTLTSAPSPKLFALIPESQASKSVPNNNYIAIAPANKQNIRYIGGNETLGPRKRRQEEVSSTNSNNDVRQINNARSGIDEFSDRTEDEMNAFGLFVALNLRKLSMQSALSAQADILSVLTRYRLNDSAANLPPKQIVPYILTNGSSPTQNPVLLQKVFLKN